LIVTNKFRNGIVYWTEDKIELLFNEYPYVNTEEFYNKYFKNDISLSTMYNKITRLGIKKDDEFVSGWTKDEDEFLKNNYRNLDMSVADIAKYLGKDENAVQYRAVNVFGIYRKDELFNEEERELIRELYPHYRTSDFIDRFPNRTVEQLERYANRMDIRKTKDYIRWVTLEGTRNSLEISKPQQIINNVLDDLGINYISEYDCNYYLVDQYLTDYNLMIEVQGDYWHCSPLLSNRSNTSGIKKNKTKDKRKHTYIKNQYGIEILYLWETDINENLKLCIELIKTYIKNNGVLENYHSFNYILDNGDLKLIPEKYVVGY
jgi:G:T-mismatch repair DNA endonuclease (very short patch repair protein)